MSGSHRLARRSDLPERVLLHDLAVADGPEVTASDLDRLSLGRRSGQGPLGGPAVTVDEVLVVLIPDVGDPRETRGEGLADRLPANEPGAPGIGPRGPSKTASSAKWAMIPSRSCSSKAVVMALSIAIASSWSTAFLRLRSAPVEEAARASGRPLSISKCGGSLAWSGSV